MKQAHVYIAGYVQSVGFRRFVLNEAKKRNLRGWVRNLTDRRVEAVLQSSADVEDEKGEKMIQEVIKLCHTGPMMAQVSTVNYVWEPASLEFKGFELLDTATV